jgi:hypothetical protein
MTSKTTNKFSPEVPARAVRMVLDHANEHPSRWAAFTSTAIPESLLSRIARDISRARNLPAGTQVLTGLLDTAIVVKVLVQGIERKPSGAVFPFALSLAYSLRMPSAG